MSAGTARAGVLWSNGNACHTLYSAPNTDTLVASSAPNTNTASSPAPSPWLTAAEAAARARVGVKTIYRETRAGRLRAARIGGRRDTATYPNGSTTFYLNRPNPSRFIAACGVRGERDRRRRRAAARRVATTDRGSRRDIVSFNKCMSAHRGSA